MIHITQRQSDHVLDTIDAESLSGVAFCRLCLVAADLRGADMHESTFFHVNLAMADLREADLTDAVLFRVNLMGADLRGAKLDNVEMCHIRHDGATRWPIGFDPATVEARTPTSTTRPPKPKGPRLRLVP
jgi:hypothetical protein